MSEFNRSEAYDFAYAVPAVKIPKPEQPVRKNQNNSKAKPVTKKKSLSAAVRTFRVVALAAVLLTLFAGLLFTRINIETLDKETAKLQSMLSDAQSENTRLNARLSATVSREKVEAYATKVLGMHKLERYQVHYFEDRAGDEVVIANGKAPVEKAELN